MTTARRFQRWAASTARGAVQLAGVGGLVLAAACSTVQLVPLHSSEGSEVLAAGSGVEVRAESDAHVSAVPAAFTPLRLTIRNTGAQPVYVDLQDIQLTGTKRSLDAVRPLDIPPRQHVASLGMDPGSSFIIQQGRNGGGPRIGRSESVLLEPHPGSHYPDSPSNARAREEILHSAFNGGPIASGETRRGYVYFLAIPTDAGQLTLRVGVRPSRQSAPRSVVEIAYAVRSS